MKYENLIPAIGAATVIVGAILKVLHVPAALIVIMLGCAVTILSQAWQVSLLKKRIKELESKS